MATVKVWSLFYNRRRREQIYAVEAKQTRTKELRIRLTRKEYNIILEKAKDLAKVPAVYVREIAVGIEKKPGKSLRERERWMKVGKLGAELLQLKRAVFEHEQIPQEFISKLDEAVMEIKELRKRLE